MVAFVVHFVESEHVPETEEYGISSFVFKSKKPFHPVRFLNYLNQSFPQNIIRSKGMFWLASRSNQALIWSSAGGSCKVDSAGVWWASMDYAKRMSHTTFSDNKSNIEAEWHTLYGDRKIELVFIGQHLAKEKIIAKLKTCLLTSEEISGLGEPNETRLGYAFSKDYGNSVGNKLKQRIANTIYKNTAVKPGVLSHFTDIELYFEDYRSYLVRVILYSCA